MYFFTFRSQRLSFALTRRPSLNTGFLFITGLLLKLVKKQRVRPGGNSTCLLIFTKISLKSCPRSSPGQFNVFLPPVKLTVI